MTPFVVKLKDLKYHDWWGSKISALKNLVPVKGDEKVDSFEELFSGFEAPDKINLKLLKLRTDLGEYQSVLDFHLDFLELCRSAQIYGPGNKAGLHTCNHYKND